LKTNNLALSYRRRSAFIGGSVTFFSAPCSISFNPCVRRLNHAAASAPTHYGLCRSLMNPPRGIEPRRGIAARPANLTPQF